MMKKSLKRLKRRRRFYAWIGGCGVTAMIAGIGHDIRAGRSLERLTTADEAVKLGATIDSIEARIDQLHVERVVAGIIDCESGGRHDELWGDGGKSYGVAQFNEETFHRFAAKAGMPHLEWKDRDDQITLLRWAVVNGFGRSWSCYGKAMTG
ncbi:MAG: hypothetical protein HY886_10715 [Deltaproteobacteria bacterium]|nr:hypothetical protein [Deltaproteobacteria bacterium]